MGRSMEMSRDTVSLYYSEQLESMSMKSHTKLLLPHYGTFLSSYICATVAHENGRRWKTRKKALLSSETPLLTAFNGEFI